MAKGKKNKVKVDFSQTESFGVPEGTYKVTVASVMQKVGEESGKTYIQFTLKVVEGEQKGSKLRHICSLQPQALFNLRNTLIALGLDVPQSSLTLDLDDLVNRLMMVDIENETYQGRKQSRVVEVSSLEDSSSEEEEGEGGDGDWEEKDEGGESSAAEGDDEGDDAGDEGDEDDDEEL